MGALGRYERITAYEINDYIPDRRKPRGSSSTEGKIAPLTEVVRRLPFGLPVLDRPEPLPAKIASVRLPLKIVAAGQKSPIPGDVESVSVDPAPLKNRRR